MHKFRIALGATAAALALTSPVYADDWFPSYDTGMWNSLYVGAHVGGAQGDSDWFFPDFGTRTSPGLDTGASFGGQVGVMHQFGPLVAGAEVSYSGFDNLDGSSVCPNPSFTCHNSIDNLLLLNGRLGYAFGPLLLYGTGGWARSHVELNANSALNSEHASGDSSGWDAGAGLEYMIAHNVSLGVQYTHVELDNDNFRLLNGSGNFVENVRVNPTFDVVEARLNIMLDSRRAEPVVPLK